MKNVFIFIILIFLTCCNQPKNNINRILESNFVFNDILNFNWKYTKDSVLLKESSLYYRRENNYEYLNGTLKINKFDSNATFKFSNDSLIECQYILTKRYYYTTEFIYDFEEIQDILKKKYGEPTTDEQIWTSSFYRSYKEYWGVALTLGNLKCKSLWELKDGSIVEHILKGGKNKQPLEIEHYIRFYSNH